MNAYLVLCSLVKGVSGKSLNLTSFPAGRDFTALLSPNGLQTAAVAGMKVFTEKNKSKLHGGGSGSKGKWPYKVSAKYTYDLDFGTPSATLSGSAIDGSVAVTGSAHAAVTLSVLPSLGVDYKAYAKPTPSLTFNLAIQSSDLFVQINKIAPFTLLLEPQGSVLTWILSALADIVVQPIVAVVTPIVSQCFNSMTFQVYTCPDYTISTSGVSVTFKPTNVDQTSYGSAVELVGDLKS
jgi:hypothetical protein